MVMLVRTCGLFTVLLLMACMIIHISKVHMKNILRDHGQHGQRVLVDRLPLVVIVPQVQAHLVRVPQVVVLALVVQVHLVPVLVQVVQALQVVQVHLVPVLVQVVQVLQVVVQALLHHH